MEKTKIKALHRSSNKILIVTKEFEGFWKDENGDTYPEYTLDFRSNKHY